MSVKHLLDAVKKTALPLAEGTVTSAEECVVNATLPGAKVGMRVSIFPADGPPLAAEVAAFDAVRVRLHPLDAAAGVGPGDIVRTDPMGAHLYAGPTLLGRVLDALGRPADDRGSLSCEELQPLFRPPPHALSRPPVNCQLVTGIRVLDGCLALGHGQRIGLFAGPGVGKSTLLATLAKRAEVDVSVVCLVGERGREVNEFIHESLGQEGMDRTVVVTAGADLPPMARVRALETATAAAEWFRDKGLRVLLLVDSLTRVVRAKREAAFALGEPSARGGYPASAFSFLPGIIERAGCNKNGSITAIYAVLTEGTGDDPIAEEARSLLDGHIVLSERRAHAGKWPAVDIVRSVSRVFEKVVPEAVQLAAAGLKRMESAYRENEDLILMGAYRRGASKDTDAAMDRKDAIEAFLCQNRNDASTLPQTFSALTRLVNV